jgi:hypothetical protein
VTKGDIDGRLKTHGIRRPERPDNELFTGAGHYADDVPGCAISTSVSVSSIPLTMPPSTWR